MATTILRGKHLFVGPGGPQGWRIITDGAVFQRDGVIEAVGPYDEVRRQHQADETLGGPGYVVMPGLVNAHHHGRGLSTVPLGRADDSLERWLLAGWGFRGVDGRLGALLSSIRMIRTGTTTVMHNHASGAPDTVEADALAALDAYRETGMRVAFSLGFRDRNRVVYGDDDTFLASLPAPLADRVKGMLERTAQVPDDYFQLVRRLRDEAQTRLGDRVRVLMNANGVHWATDEFLQRASHEARAAGSGFHMHLLETVYQREAASRLFGHTSVQHLEELGVLGPEVSLAHGVWLADDDMALLAERGAWVCHNASSNLRLRSGIAPVNVMLRHGVHVAMGTDGSALNDDDDMFQEMRLVSRLHREVGLETTCITPEQVLEMATVGGAGATTFGDRIGVLEPGRRADMVLLSWRHAEEPYAAPDVDPVALLLLRARGVDVDTVVIDGQVVYREGRFTRIDPDAVLAEAREMLSQPPSQREVRVREMVRELVPYVEQYYAGWLPDELRPYYVYNGRQ